MGASERDAVLDAGDTGATSAAETYLRRMLETISRIWTDKQIRTCVIAGLFAFFVYELSREPGKQNFNQYVRLADAFLHGHVDIISPPSWLELVVYHGHHYSHQGALPAILLMPFVAVFGTGLNPRHLAALLGGGVSLTAWSLATRVGLDGWRRVAGWAFPILGTTLWFEAKAGSTWGIAALASAFFLFVALNEYFGPRRLWVVGLTVGLAALSRPPAIFALIGFALAVRNPRRVAQLAMGALGPVLVYFAYNYARYQTIFDKTQELHYLADGYRFQVPPGQFSFAHIPFNLYSWFLMSPQYQGTFPYIRPTMMGTALPLTSPAFLSAFSARRERWMWLAIVCVITPAALFYANGFAQFGMRYLLDAVPFLTALIFLALKDGRAKGYVPLLLLSIAINTYGVAFTTVFGLKQ